MRIIALIITIIAISLISGCSSSMPEDKTMNTDQNAAAIPPAVDSDLSIDEESIDPDIGELDDIEVSDELPE
ncbi:MAG TPA: hypothetical protein VEC16_02440 [Alphaproteobacteria bacterium]|nr:hypothetical protein [Alphaproteobacteria bacterium]